MDRERVELINVTGRFKRRKNTAARCPIVQSFFRGFVSPAGKYGGIMKYVTTAFSSFQIYQAIIRREITFAVNRASLNDTESISVFTVYD
jgi:hypothetical protein